MLSGVASISLAGRPRGAFSLRLQLASLRGGQSIRCAWWFAPAARRSKSLLRCQATGVAHLGDFPGSHQVQDLPWSAARSGPDSKLGVCRLDLVASSSRCQPLALGPLRPASSADSRFETPVSQTMAISCGEAGIACCPHALAAASGCALPIRVRSRSSMLNFGSGKAPAGAITLGSGIGIKLHACDFRGFAPGRLQQPFNTRTQA